MRDVIIKTYPIQRLGGAWIVGRPVLLLLVVENGPCILKMEHG